MNWTHVAAALAVLAIGDMGLAQRQNPTASARISDVSWLAGEWIATGGATIEERWTPAAGGAMLATSRTLKGDRMVGFEYLRIVERDGGLVYIAQPGGRPPTEFTLTRRTERSATFENPAHDFPKVIEYMLRADGRLEAHVGDGVRNVETFTFTRAR